MGRLRDDGAGHDRRPAGSIRRELFVRSRLFGVDSIAAVGIGAAAVVGVLLVISLALWLPVRRATRIDPIDALRYE